MIISSVGDGRIEELEETSNYYIFLRVQNKGRKGMNERQTEVNSSAPRSPEATSCLRDDSRSSRPSALDLSLTSRSLGVRRERSIPWSSFLELESQRSKHFTFVIIIMTIMDNI